MHQYHTMIIGTGEAPIALAGPLGHTTMIARPGFVNDLGEAMDTALTACVIDPVTLLGPWTHVGQRELSDPATLLRSRGWHVTGSEDTGWFRCVRAGREVLLGILPAMDPSKVRLFDPAWAPIDIARQVAQYRRLTGHPWYGTAGMVGTRMVRQLRHRTAPLWRWDDFPRGMLNAGSGELRWQHPYAEGESPARKYRHTFDVTAAYLSAASQARLAFDRLELTGQIEWDPTRAGYWLVHLDLSWKAMITGTSNRAAPPLLPESKVIDDPAIGQSLAWLTTPMMEYLWQTEDSVPPIVRTFTAPKASRLLYGWYEQLRPAVLALGKLPSSAELVAADQYLSSAVKGTYTETVGMLGRAGGRVFRRDWYHTVIDTFRAQLHRKIDRVWWARGVWPERIHVDSVTYTSDDEDPTELAGLLGSAGQIGQFRHVSTDLVFSDADPASDPACYPVPERIAPTKPEVA